MARQGSLRQRTLSGGLLIQAAMFVCALTVWSCLDLSSLVAQENVATNSQVDLKLRLTWSAPQSKFWRIRVAVKGNQTDFGTISDLVNRCEALAATGSFQLAEDGSSFCFAPRESIAGGEVDFVYQGSPQAQVNVQVVGNPAYSRTPTTPTDPAWGSLSSKQITVSELARGQTAHSDEAAPGETDWSLGRTTDDQIRIADLSNSGFTEVSGTFSFSVRANSLVDTPEDLLLVYTLRQASTGKVVTERRWPVSVDSDGNSVSVDVDEPAPAVPGVYEVHCRLEKDDDHLLMRLRRRNAPVVATSTPLVVTLPTGGETKAPDGAAWQQVGRIQPAKDSNWELNQWIPNSSKRLIRRIDPRDSSDLLRSTHAGHPVSVLRASESYVASLPRRQASLPHKVTIRYPAGKQTRIRVQIDSSEEFENPSREFLIADDHRMSDENEWHVHTFVHYPSGRHEFIRLTNQNTDAEAKFESITVESGGITLSAHEDRKQTPRSAALNLQGWDWVDQLTADIRGTESQRALHPNTRALHRAFVAAQRISDYARAAGFSTLFVQGCSGGQFWLETDQLLPSRKDNPLEGRYLPTLMRIADTRAIDVIVRVDVSAQLSGIETALRKDAPVKGALRRYADNSVRYNIRHPLVQSHLQSLLDQFNEQLGAHRSYAGLALQCGSASHLGPVLARHLDLQAMRDFAASVGKANATQAELIAWIQNDGREQLQGWLQGKSLQAYEFLAAGIEGDVYLLLDDPGLVAPGNASSNLKTVVDLRRYGNDSLEKETTGSIKVAPRTSSRRVDAVLLGQHRQQDVTASPYVRDVATKDLTDVIVGLSPSMLIVDDSFLTLGLSTSIGQLLTSFCSLPESSMREVAGADTAARTVRVKFARQGTNHILVLCNLAPWSTDVQVDLTKALAWTGTAGNVATGGKAVQSSWKLDEKRLTASLMPGALVVLSAPDDSPKSRPIVRTWTSRVSGGSQTMTDIKDKVTVVVERLGALTDPAPYEHLSNGGFEKSGGVGIPGWMHTQHPRGAVRIDSGEAIAGRQSVVLTTDQQNSSRAWLVSETIVPPASGRLAVSLACRGETEEGDKTHRLRVSIEGIRDGQPFRQSKEFEVPKDGQWQPRKVVLEAGGIEPSKVDSVRLTIDSLSSGRVWIDEVYLHDWFPTATERGELEGDAFLAVQGLQRGNVTPAARLLNNYWALYLINQKQTKKHEPVLQTTQQQEEPPGMAERIKSWLPRPLRF